MSVWHEKQGTSVDETVHHYPTTTRAEVNGALAYCWDHLDEIERVIADEKAFVEEARRGHLDPLQETLAQCRVIAGERPHHRGGHYRAE